MAMSPAARARMRVHEKAKYCYYDDGGRPGVGNCTWGIGTLAHLGPCTTKELKTKVEPAQVEVCFATRVADAERVVRRDVKRQQLTQDQFDALVSFHLQRRGKPGRQDARARRGGQFRGGRPRHLGDDQDAGEDETWFEIGDR